MSFFQRVGNAMARFMYGRNGGDRLGLVTIWTAIVIDVVCLFIKGYQVPYLILSTLSTAMVLWADVLPESGQAPGGECVVHEQGVLAGEECLRPDPDPDAGSGAQVHCLPQVPDGMPGPPWEGTHRHYLSQVPGGDPYQELNRSCCKARFL